MLFYWLSFQTRSHLVVVVTFPSCELYNLMEIYSIRSLMSSKISSEMAIWYQAKGVSSICLGLRYVHFFKSDFQQDYNNKLQDNKSQQDFLVCTTRTHLDKKVCPQQRKLFEWQYVRWDPVGICWKYFIYCNFNFIKSLTRLYYQYTAGTE